MRQAIDGKREKERKKEKRKKERDVADGCNGKI